MSGLVLEESENAFRVITQQHAIKRLSSLLFSFPTILIIRHSVIPKHRTVFAVALPLYLDSHRTGTVLDSPHIEILLYGSQFQFRSAERAGRKMKSKPTIELYYRGNT
jgi:ribonuclease P protein subunit POP4